MSLATVPFIRFQALQIVLNECLERLKVCNLVHYDIKPENIMIQGTTGKYVLIDLGLVICVVEHVREFSPGYSLI